MSKTYSAGIVTAYGAAKRAGYQGTYEDFCRQQAGYAESAAAVEAAKTAAQTAANTATTKATEATTAATAAQTAKTQTEAAASQALTDIGTARTAAISAVQTEGATQTANATAQAQAAATSATTASTKASEASASATSAGQSATNAAASATSAAQSASDAQDVLDSIPADYSDLSANVSQLRADLTTFVGCEFITFTNGKYIKTNLNVGDLVDLTPVTGYNTNNYAIVDVQEGDRITINATGGNAGRLWCFIDSTNHLISVSAPRAMVSDFVLVAPEYASKLILNPVTGYGNIFMGENLNKAIDDISGIQANLGDLGDLETTDKSSIVAAINEVAQSEATTTVQDGSISKSKLASDVLVPVNDVSTIKKVIGNNIVSASSAFDNITWATGYFHATTGAVTGNSSYRYTEEYFDVNIIQFVKKCSLQTKNISSVVFYDGGKEIVGVIDTTSNGGSFVVTSIPVPQDAVYFRLCQIATNINPIPITFYTVDDLMAKSETDLPVNIQSVLTSQGGISVDGNLLTYSDWKVTDYIKVVPGMLLKYSGCGNIGGNATLCPIAFYDSDKNPILVIRPTESRYVSIYNNGWANDSAIGTSLNFGFIFAPPAARYCRLSGYRTLQPTISVTTIEPWAGKKCAFFGDSITAGIGTVEKYCNFLAMIKGITVANYAVNGSILVTNGMDRVTAFVTDYADNPADAFIFAYGTNDWGNNKDLGDWYTTDSNGVRTLTTDTTTFRGALVQILTYLKTNFDGKKIILMTPIHRGAGSYTSDLTRNSKGLYLEDYVNVIKEAGEIFSVDVIDLYGESGLTPDINPNTAYFTGNDRLHPNAEGHKRMARVISAKMGKMTI